MIISRVSSWRLLVGDSIITPGLGTGVPGSVRSLALGNAGLGVPVGTFRITSMVLWTWS